MYQNVHIKYDFKQKLKSDTKWNEFRLVAAKTMLEKILPACVAPIPKNSYKY